MQFAVLLSYHAKVKGENEPKVTNPTINPTYPNPILPQPYPNPNRTQPIPNPPGHAFLRSQLLGSKPALKSYRWVVGGGWWWCTWIIASALLP